MARKNIGILKANSLLQAALAKVKQDLMEYESDTFGAEDSEITEAEVIAVMAKLIPTNIELGQNIDGIKLTELLEEVREGR